MSWLLSCLIFGFANLFILSITSDLTKPSTTLRSYGLFNAINAACNRNHLIWNMKKILLHLSNVQRTLALTQNNYLPIYFCVSVYKIVIGIAWTQFIQFSLSQIHTLKSSQTFLNPCKATINGYNLVHLEQSVALMSFFPVFGVGNYLYSYKNRILRRQC